MKLTTILLLMTFVSVSAKGFSQGSTMSIKLNNTSLKEVFNEIKNQSGYSFVYSEKAIEGIEVSELNVTDETIDQIMGSCLQGTALDYYIDNNVVVIRKKAPEAIKTEQEKKKTLKGTVTDTDGNTLPGVSVVIKGTTTGVATDIDGKYSIDIEGNAGILLFSFVGMLPQELAFAGQDVLNVTLVEDSETLGEVIVTGYQIISKERASGSFVTIKSEELETVMSVKLSDKIEGLVSGVVSYGDEVRLRGVNRLSRPDYGNNSGEEEDYSPLVVVDGFASKMKLNDLNPADVESITVLKDAAAASIYGARSANGVFIVTMKKGKKGKATFNASIDHTYQGKPDFGYYDYASSSDVIDLELEHLANFQDYQDNPGTYNNDKTLYSPVMAYTTDLKLGNINQAEYDAKIADLRDNNYLDEFSKYVLRPKKSTQYNFSISQGTENSSMYLSLNYVQSESDVITDSNDLLRVNMNNQLNLFNNKVKLTYGLFGSYSTADNSETYAWNSATQKLPYERLVDENGNPAEGLQAKNQKVITDYVDQNPGQKSLEYIFLDELQLNDNQTTNLRIRANVGLNVELTKWLNYDMKFSFENQMRQKLTNHYEESYTMRYAYNRALAGEFYLPQTGDALNNDRSTTSEYLFRNQLNFSKVFDDDHSVTVLGGSEISRSMWKRDEYKVYGFNPELNSISHVNNEEIYYGYGAWDPYGITYEELTRIMDQENKLASFYGNMGYSYKNKYNFTASIRYDMSNLFGQNPEYLYRPLWSVGASWNLTEESFVDVEWLNMLKLRATYGINGNMPGTSSAMSTASYSPSRYTDQLQGSLIWPANPNLRWERTYTKNVGVDFSVLNNRLSGSIDYYDRFSDDLLSNTELDPAFGWKSMYLNVGEMQNRGFEISLRGQIIKNNDFSWTSSLEFSHNKNEIVDLDIEPTRWDDLLKNSLMHPMFVIGNAYNTMYAYSYAGLNSEGQPTVYNAEGEAVYDDVTDIEAIKSAGTATPIYSGSFKNSFSYKGFTLAALFIFHGGHVMRDRIVNINPMEDLGASGHFHKDINDRWMKPGDELTTDIPRMTFYQEDRSAYFRDRIWSYSDRNVIDASYIKLRSLNLSYSVPKAYLSKLGVESLKLSAQGKNLWILTANDRGIDPEGFSATTPSYTFGLNVNF